MAERVILQWNMTNWITVLLMVSVGTALIGIALSSLRAYSSPAS